MNLHVTTDSQPLRNITPFDELVLEIDDLFAEAANWADGSPVENQAQCDALDVLDKALLDAGKRLDALRVEEKRPLDEQVQAIQDRYNPFIQPKKGKVDLARSALNPVRAKMVKAPEGYAWSSYRPTMGLDPVVPGLCIDYLLGQFAKTKPVARRRYAAFVHAGIGGVSPWGNLKGQVLLGSEPFVEKIAPRLKASETVAEIPKRQRRLHR